LTFEGAPLGKALPDHYSETIRDALAAEKLFSEKRVPSIKSLRLVGGE